MFDCDEEDILLSDEVLCKLLSFGAFDLSWLSAKEVFSGKINTVKDQIHDCFL